MSDRDERKEHGDELVVGSTYCIKFGDYGVGGSFTGKFLGWFPAPENMNDLPGDVPLMAHESHDWAWAKFDTGYVSGDRWEAKRLYKNQWSRWTAHSIGNLRPRRLFGNV